jgi:predicted small lipoprotein YifL
MRDFFVKFVVSVGIMITRAACGAKGSEDGVNQ